jgi:TolA-binding protein
MLKVRYSLSLLILSSYLFAEPSAFDAGVIDSDNPYGLSESERMLVENRKRSLSNQKLIRKQAILIEQLQEKIEGLESVVDSLSSKMGQTGQKLNELDSLGQKESSDDIKNLQDQIDAIKEKNSEYYKKIDKSLKNLTKLISGSVVDSDKKSSYKSSHKSKTKKETPLSNAKLLQSAIQAYRSKNYKKAEEIFTKLATKNYKPAQTNFYLGEISYYTKKYDDAIAFYKTSVGFYDKASYMPKLLLHTALSFKKLGEGDSAKQFFRTLIDSYPDSPEANIAKKY